ncbi:hypothetical protein RQP46_002535 [Phenoliferia psychrophenolica]
MARASFSTLPLELKARIVEMTSDQEDAWSARMDESDERAGHINGLSSLALVNKELRGLAAVHQFKTLHASRSSPSVFRFIILPQHGHHIKEVVFFGPYGEGSTGYTISILSQLPALRALEFEAQTAKGLFGPGVTLRRDLEDEDASNRATMLAYISSRIEHLTLSNFKPSEAVALVRKCPNLKVLCLSHLKVGEQQDLSSAIASARGLKSLAIAMELEVDWPPEALAPLERDPPPIHTLQLLNFALNTHTFKIIDVFSSTIESVDPTDPTLLAFLDSQPTIRHLYLDRLLFYPFTAAYPSEDPLLPSSVADFADLVHSRNLDPSLLDRPHLTPFHPDAYLDFTSEEQPLLSRILRRTLEFGLVELDRMDAEGNVAKAVGWVEKLKALEDERLAWKD